ncbi:trimeric intracellular cation channel type B-like isoform X1 [Acipenser ruthenus]|uniref:trimeric intracellular cation channel type B-like isoform X1 n=2 Tax=Acipenser ruthenus TaxID=7906 RepID=UPI0015602077|nr:trimeric intracellular cation channel type B-like isoform X1 [Acipenser ruthenus]
MEQLLGMNFDEVSLQFSKISMYPLFDAAHYIVSVMALREQPGAVDVARRSPFACWISAMIYCFGGAVLSGLFLAEPALLPFSNTSNIVLASIIWYLVFYFPMDLVYKFTAFLPLRLVLASMKEVTRTWKVVGGVAHARARYEEGWLVMIAVGWAKGAGGGLMSNFEQLVRGVWKPETNELLKMSYPVKVTLVGSVLFTLQQSQYLPLAKHQLMFMYTMFLVINKIRMMITPSTTSVFAPFEAVLYSLLFQWQTGVQGPSGAPKKGIKGRRENPNGSTDTNGNISESVEEKGNGTTVSRNGYRKKTD